MSERIADIVVSLAFVFASASWIGGMFGSHVLAEWIYRDGS